MNAHQLRHIANREEITSLQLNQWLDQYRQPRDKIKRLIAQGELIRVKQGIYVFGPTVARKPFSPWTLAQWIYGPSAISCHTACSFHGIIPEQVVATTSIALKRDKCFHTPVGTFIYRYLHPKKFYIGLERLTLDHESILMAGPEKALCDLVALTIKKHHLETLQDTEYLLYDDLRCNEEVLQTFNLPLLYQLCQSYHRKNLWMIYHHLNPRAAT